MAGRRGYRSRFGTVNVRGEARGEVGVAILDIHIIMLIFKDFPHRHVVTLEPSGIS
jgi:hypothetical protein